MTIGPAPTDAQGSSPASPTEDDAATSQPRRSQLPLYALAVVALLAGLGVGRFVTAGEPDPSGPVTAAVTPVASGDSLEARVSRLEEAVEADPEDAASWQALGLAYVKQAQETADPSFYDLAERALGRAEKLAPEDPRTLLGQGRLALARHDFGKARRLGQQARDLAPYDAAVLGVLVDANVELGRYERAADRLEEMLDLEPGLPALSRVSYLRELHGDLPGAVDAMQQAEAAGPDAGFEASLVTALLGDLRLKQGDVDAAERAYQRALARSSDQLAAEVGLARVEAIRGDLVAATTRLEELVDRNPRPDAAILLGSLQSLEGREEEAARTDELVRTIVRLQQDAGQSVDLELAVFEADRGDPARAVELARAAYEARPDNVFAADALAWALFADGQPGKAAARMDEALRLDPAAPLLRYHAAEVYAAADQLDRAREQLRAAFSTTPWFSLRHQDDAEALADELGVDTPAEWDR